ncbi:hypothetical protein E4U39_003245 [Claviceps sp. Clav50 group G5]|nr:hypothetical protein E4U39_003245 [Claviceps sp. Clav50 group G5]
MTPVARSAAGDYGVEWICVTASRPAFHQTMTALLTVNDDVDEADDVTEARRRGGDTLAKNLQSRVRTWKTRAGAGR